MIESEEVNDEKNFINDDGINLYPCIRSDES